MIIKLRHLDIRSRHGHFYYSYYLGAISKSSFSYVHSTMLKLHPCTFTACDCSGLVSTKRTLSENGKLLRPLPLPPLLAFLFLTYILSLLLFSLPLVFLSVVLFHVLHQQFSYTLFQPYRIFKVFSSHLFPLSLCGKKGRLWNDTFSRTVASSHSVSTK